jgi:hypothetical protein
VRRVGPLQQAAGGSTQFKTLAVIGQLTFEVGCTASVGINIGGLFVKSSVAHAAYASLSRGPDAPVQFSDPNLVANTRYQLGGVGGPGFGTVSGEALSADNHQVSYELYVGQDVGTVTNHSCVAGGTFVLK